MGEKRKVLAIFTGRKEQYSEFIAKTALMGAAEEGAEVQAVNLLNLDLKPCTGCKMCHMFQNGTNGDCVLKDDFLWLDDKIMESDALIVCMPAYEKTVPGEFKILMDRTGPSHDIAFRNYMVKMREDGKVKESAKPIDPRSFKKRPVIFLGHGGTDWNSLLLPVMEAWAIPLGLQVVDLQLFPWNLKIYFDDEAISKMMESGRNLVRAIGDKNVSYAGPKGQCPVCHSDVMILKGGRNVECAVCSMKGEIRIENDEAVCIFPEEEIGLSHMMDGGRNKHLDDINGFQEIIFSMDFMKLSEIKQKHMRWLETIRPEKED